jgi:hypothetical protein
VRRAVVLAFRKHGKVCPDAVESYFGSGVTLRKAIEAEAADGRSLEMAYLVKIPSRWEPSGSRMQSAGRSVRPSESEGDCSFSRFPHCQRIGRFLLRYSKLFSPSAACLCFRPLLRGTKIADGRGSRDCATAIKLISSCWSSGETYSNRAHLSSTSWRSGCSCIMSFTY